MKLRIVLVVAGVFAASEARADLWTKAAREAIEFAAKKFGKEVAEEGAEKLAGRIVSAASRHGDDVIQAVRKVGPKALNLADEAGENAPRVMRLLTRHGDDAARVLARPKGMALFTRFGDDAAEVLIKHKGVAEPLVEGLGKPAVEALKAVAPRNGRRLAMMAEGGELAALGHSPELMGVIARNGDRAMDFVWKHKGALAVGTTLTAFLANPEPFLDGTNQLADTVTENVVKPVVHDVVRPVVQETAKAASSFLWMVTMVVGGTSLAGVYIVAKHPHAAADVAKALIGLTGKAR